MKPKVLIVDDDPVNIEVLEGYLSKDYDILKAHDGYEAITIVEANPPDIILLDILMPGMNGYEVCKKLKDDRKTDHIPIIMVTSLREIEDRNKAIEAGADDFITKPFDVVELSVRVKSYLRTKLYYDTMLGNASFQLHLLVL
ncbi:MAG: response regulator [Candidatus Methanoperedens sp.]|nr:response regulator [Candidatus Methanoperedens sp.]